MDFTEWLESNPDDDMFEDDEGEPLGFYDTDPAPEDDYESSPDSYISEEDYAERMMEMERDARFEVD